MARLRKRRIRIDERIRLFFGLQQKLRFPKHFHQIQFARARLSDSHQFTLPADFKILPGDFKSVTASSQYLQSLKRLLAGR